MKHISEVDFSETFSKNNNRGKNIDKSSVDNSEDISKLWAALCELYGRKFISENGDVPTKTWLIELRSFSRERLRVGYSRCRKEHKKWPPNALEFRELCEPTLEEFGLPETREAFNDACQGRFYHKFARQAAIKVGSYRLRNEPERVTYPLFSYNYEQLCRKFRNGEDLRVSQAIEFKHKTILDDVDSRGERRVQEQIKAVGSEKGREFFLKLKKKLGVSK